MLKRLRPDQTVDLFSERALSQLNIGDGNMLGSKVLSFDQIQRLVLIAIGLSNVHAVSDKINASHMGLAAFVASKADQAMESTDQAQETTDVEASSSFKAPT